MNNAFFYENDQGDIIDEQGNESMDWEEEANPHHLENITNHVTHRNTQSPEIDIEDVDVGEKMESLAEKIKKKLLLLNVFTTTIMTIKKLSFYTTLN